MYNPTLSQHTEHLRTTLQVLRLNKLYIKKSKCAFAQPQVEYLGLIISGVGVSTDPQKVATMTAWPRLANVKALRGFLGLAGYYRRFVKDYGLISKPLTELLKKDGFYWNDKAEEAFGKLKIDMSEVPTLGLPDLSQPFVLEIDASDFGVGAVLMQGGWTPSFH